jgi:hypothetical protein
MHGRSRQRQRVFLSYSHKDEKYLQEFMPFLKSLADRKLIDPWSDERIEPSQRWHDEIRATIESAAAAVLLVSQDFLASDYIREYEVPPLLRAREEEGVPVACLFVKPSLADHKEMVFQAGSAKEPVRLTDYQGLNDPKRPLSAMGEHERLETYKVAAKWAIDAVGASPRPEPFRQPAPEQRRDLGIRLTMARGYLEHSYFSGGYRITEHRSPWLPLREGLEPWISQGPFALQRGLGEALFRLLFGDESKTREVLSAIFQATAGVEPRPILHPARVRIETEEPVLRELSWHYTAWEGRRLWASAGWTFELASASPGADRPDVLLKAPCSVLLCGARDAQGLDLDVHFRAVEELLHRAWPAYTEPPRIARDGEGIANSRDVAHCLGRPSAAGPVRQPPAGGQSARG